MVILQVGSLYESLNILLRLLIHPRIAPPNASHNEQTVFPISSSDLALRFNFIYNGVSMCRQIPCTRKKSKKRAVHTNINSPATWSAC